MGLFVDPAAVHADDDLLDTLGAGRPPCWFTADDPVTEVLVAWRDEVDRAPIPVPRPPVPAAHPAGRRAASGRHSRRGAHGLADEVRHSLLATFVGPLDPDEDGPLGRLRRGMSQQDVRRREWCAIRSALGDLVGDVAGLFLAVLAGLALSAVAVLALWQAPWWLRAAVLVAALVGCWMGVALRRASRRLDVLTGSLDELLDGGESR